jgi:hypothetical protein
MKLFIYALVIPAFIAFLAFSFCNYDWANHNWFVGIGWALVVWVVGFATLWIINPKK